ncbi:hypothetical protein [Polyangium jinanense]|uniref:Lipoprotein n=1 Tax=Polyangium jinanense TaxID=2829994 RepID=A0A9X3XBW8_9BACT|nr:hypothetical protein [Polyangium jinanense]MDC3957473.1 hypothetical protein [Polyangium jinanense]MDC3985036.1 hypothetical protein [Polyangium jinanense]
MNRISKFFALLGLAASIAFVGTGCVAGIEDPEAELAIADESADLETLGADDVNEATAENQAALSSQSTGGFFMSILGASSGRGSGPSRRGGSSASFAGVSGRFDVGGARDGRP